MAGAFRGLDCEAIHGKSDYCDGHYSAFSHKACVVGQRSLWNSPLWNFVEKCGTRYDCHCGKVWKCVEGIVEKCGIRHNWYNLV